MPTPFRFSNAATGGLAFTDGEPAAGRTVAIDARDATVSDPRRVYEIEFRCEGDYTINIVVNDDDLNVISLGRGLSTRFKSRNGIFKIKATILEATTDAETPAGTLYYNATEFLNEDPNANVS